MSVRDQVSEAYELLNGPKDSEGVHIHLTKNAGRSNEEDVGIIEFLDETTVYVEKYGEETSDVRDASDMSETEFKSFVMDVLSL